jgi:hypothetical protein|tara:strand:- start:2401 stop:2616 length:216 start_codon:yes stop_codon:yes gene_type:complete
MGMSVVGKAVGDAGPDLAGGTDDEDWIVDWHFLSPVDDNANVRRMVWTNNDFSTGYICGSSKYLDYRKALG